MMDLRSNEPFFIVGAGRSGTTLLRSLLSAHSRIAVTPETHFMKRADREGLLENEPADFDSFWERLTGWVRFQDLGVDPAHCHRKIETSGDTSFRAIFRAVLETYGERLGKPRVGEKTPGHSRYLDQLLGWYPETKVIAIQRDPRAVIASQMRAPWVTSKFTPRSVRRGVFVGKRRNELVAYSRNWANIYSVRLPRWANDPRVKLVSYERLVADPEGEIRAICAFLGEDFEPRMLGDRRDGDVPGAAGSMADRQLESWRRGHEARSSEPVNDRSLAKWRKELSRLEVGIIEACCREGMKSAGYRLETGPLGQTASRGFAELYLGLARVEAKARRMAGRVLRRADDAKL